VPKHRSPLGVGREALLIVDHYEKYGRLRPDGRRLKQGSYELFGVPASYRALAGSV
jgi:hypothetical protein